MNKIIKRLLEVLPWNKGGKKVDLICAICGKTVSVPIRRFEQASKEHKRQSRSHKAAGLGTKQ